MVDMKFNGKVIRGKREGTKIGFPTANIEVSENVASGIYAGYTSLDKRNLPSIFYVAESSSLIESHILDFPSQDLYGHEISVELSHKLRDVRQFSGLDEASKQIKKDELEAREWFKSTNGKAGIDIIKS